MMDKKPLESDPYTYYQLIGECYVDGMMGGEALWRSLGVSLQDVFSRWDLCKIGIPVAFDL
ncbi:hypothetical protein F4815DRAFT_463486 [Daldinia loculata]|nr:hypothetical protein F4815DRAFT_463486 [Daldinia loculata]